MYRLVNPSLGQEYQLNYEPETTPKKVVVVGGGPAGLEAARVLSMKGNVVSLYEKQDFLGGQFKSAAYPPAKGELSTYTSWLSQELKKYNVAIHLNTNVDKNLLSQITPDTVILATGGTPVKPPLRGIDGENVFFAEDVLLGKVSVGNNVVIAGGGEVGSETAAYLALQNKKVTIVEMRDEILLDLDRVNAFNLTKILDEYKVKYYTNNKIFEILPDGVIVENKVGLEKISADSVVLALGYKPVNDLANDLADVPYEVEIIGGASETSNAMVASRAGFDFAMYGTSNCPKLENVEVTN